VPGALLVAACGNATESSLRPSTTVTPPADVAPVAQPFEAALNRTTSVLSTLRAQEHADARKLNALSGDILAEESTYAAFRQTVISFKFPEDIRNDEVNPLIDLNQEIESDLKLAAAAPTLDTMQARLTVAHTLEWRESSVTQILARYLGLDAKLG
jgi:hypothetical protein